MNAAALREARITPSMIDDPIDVVINGFSVRVGDMAETEKSEVSELVQSLLHEIRQRPSRIHPLIYANLTFVLALVFWSGALYTRVGVLEERMRSTAAADAIGAQITELRDQQKATQSDIEQIRQRLDRFLDRTASH